MLPCGDKQYIKKSKPSHKLPDETNSLQVSKLNFNQSTLLKLHDLTSTNSSKKHQSSCITPSSETSCYNFLTFMKLTEFTHINGLKAAVTLQVAIHQLDSLFHAQELADTA